MNNKHSNNKTKHVDIRWPFRLLLTISMCFFIYMTFLTIYYNTKQFSFFELSILIIFDFIYLGILYRPILIGKFGNYFFNYNYVNTSLFKRLTIESKMPKKTSKIYFKKVRINFDQFLTSKLMVQIWGFLDLLTLILFWRYFYNNILFVKGVLIDDIIVEFSMGSYYFTALVSISLLFSGILLIIPSKLGGRIVGVQMFLKMLAYLPSIFPILWVMGFSIEHRYIKALVITTICLEFVRVATIQHYFKFDKYRNYIGYNYTTTE